MNRQLFHTCHTTLRLLVCFGNTRTAIQFSVKHRIPSWLLACWLLEKSKHLAALMKGLVNMHNKAMFVACDVAQINGTIENDNDVLQYA